MFRLERKDLRNLRDLALKEHKSFFKRNPHLEPAYGNSLIGICLCQGAASHYLNPKVITNDFDIWHFYLADEEQNFPNRAHKKAEYRNVPIDYLKRAIPEKLYTACRRKPERVIVEYLKQRKTRTKELLDKAIIGLFPERLFDKVIWTGK